MNREEELNAAVEQEFQRMLKLMQDNKTIRESLLGDAWLVMSSELGPTDITMKSLRKGQQTWN